MRRAKLFLIYEKTSLSTIKSHSITSHNTDIVNNFHYGACNLYSLEFSASTKASIASGVSSADWRMAYERPYPFSVYGNWD